MILKKPTSDSCFRPASFLKNHEGFCSKKSTGFCEGSKNFPKPMPDRKKPGWNRAVSWSPSDHGNSHSWKTSGVKKGSPDSLVGHDRISAIDVDHLTGDCGRSIAAEKSRRFADFLLSCCSFHRRMLTCNPQHFRKIFDPGCRKRPDGPWRNDIGAYIFWTQYPGQISY